jgi:hypothetical protein
MPTEYIVPVVGGEQRNNTLVGVLINKVSKLEKLQEVRMQTAEINGIQ